MLKSDVSLRRFDVSRDWEKYAELRSIADGEYISAEKLQARVASFGDRLQQDTVIIECEGEVAAMARWARFTYEKPGVANLTLATMPQFLRRGFGALAYQEAEKSAKAFGITRLVTGGKESWESLIPFSEKLGFSKFVRYVDSKAKLQDFDDQIGIDAEAHIASLGLQLRRPVVASPDDPELVALYDCFAEADADEPFTPEVGLQTFEHFCGFWKLESSQKGLIVAAYEGERCVALSRSAVGSSGEMWTEFTGVRRAWRGKKLAFSLKALLMWGEKQRGAEVLATANSSLNPAMLAINAKLKFVPGPAWIVLTKDI